MSISTRPIIEDEILTFRARATEGFGDDFDPTVLPEGWFAELFPLDRTVAAYDGDAMVGTLGAFPFEMTVPGGRAVPTAGTTVVTVSPTHTRRGVLRAMMRDHLDDTIARGEPLAALWASESSIYGRFGFGVATERDEVEIDRAYVTVEGEGGTTRLIDGDEARRVFPPIYDAMRAGTPGMMTRRPPWWKIEVFFDPEKHRDGFTAQRYLLHETDGVADGYAIYRQKGDWSSGFPNGTVKVREVIAASATAHTGLWRHLTGIDLFPTIRWGNMPVGDPLRWKVPDHRRITRKRWDALHVRILDVVAALEARSYGHDGTVRFTVDDPFLPDAGGSFELTVGDGAGRCRRVGDGAGDLRLDTADLASLYLGAGDLHAAAAAGRVPGDDDARILLGRMFRGDLAPWCEEIF